MKVAAVIALLLFVGGVAGALFMSRPMPAPADCRDGAGADGVHVPVVSDLTGSPSCDEKQHARKARVTLRNASGGVAVAGLVMMGTLLVLRQRKRTQDAARPVDRGFPPG